MQNAPRTPDEFVEDGERTEGNESLRFLDQDPPRPGQALRIAPGVRWCRLPLPMALDHINVWLLDHGDGCVIVDAGLNASGCVDAWRALEADVLAETNVRGVLITHMHPDHIGLARWLQERHNVPVWMSARSHEYVRTLVSEGDAEVAAAEAFLARHGVNDRTLRAQLSPRRFSSMLSGLPEVERHLRDGEAVPWCEQRQHRQQGSAWHCMEAYGHAEGHICLHDRDNHVLISGDQILPSISPNISLNWRSRDLDPLGSFLSSLRRLSELSPNTLVLPAHGQPFVGLQLRASSLAAHHQQQLAAIEAACATPKVAAELLPVLFRRPLFGLHVMLALAEAVAHVEHLVSRGRLERLADAAVVRYRSITRAES